MHIMAVQTQEQVLALLHEHHRHIRAFGVRRLGVFGSFVRGQQGHESDVDMLVEFEPGAKTFDAFMQLAFFLETLFERRVELLTPESLSPYIGPHILREMTYVSFNDTVSSAYPHRDPVSPGPDAGVGARDFSAR
jgi:predicted nucleotidyltransferase